MKMGIESAVFSLCLKQQLQISIAPIILHCLYSSISKLVYSEDKEHLYILITQNGEDTSYLLSIENIANIMINMSQIIIYTSMHFFLHEMNFFTKKCL